MAKDKDYNKLIHTVRWLRLRRDILTAHPMCERCEAEAARELEALRERYARRVPDAFTAAAPLNFLQYRLMGYDSMTDDELAAELDAIRRGAKRLPDDVTGILNILKLTHDIH